MFVLLVCGETTVSWPTTATAAHPSARCRLGGISCFSFLLFSPFSLAEQLKKSTRLRYFLSVALCLALHGAQRRQRERMKRAVGLTWLSCHPTAQKTEGQQRAGLQNREVGGGRAVSLSSISLKNSFCSIWSLLLSRKVLFTTGKTFYKYSLFFVLLELICYVELRSIKWENGGKVPKDKRNAEHCAFQNKHSTPWRGPGTVCAWLPNRGSCTSRNFVCILEISRCFFDTKEKVFPHQIEYLFPCLWY